MAYLISNKHLAKFIIKEYHFHSFVIKWYGIFKNLYGLITGELKKMHNKNGKHN